MTYFGIQRHALTSVFGGTKYDKSWYSEEHTSDKRGEIVSRSIVDISPQKRSDYASKHGNRGGCAYVTFKIGCSIPRYECIYLGDGSPIRQSYGDKGNYQ